MVSGFYFEWERTLILVLQSAIGPFAAAVLTAVTKLGEETALVLVLGIIYWGYDKELGERVGVNLLVASSLCAAVKNVFFRLRPYFVIPKVKCISPVNDGDIFDVALQGYSFPSGHSCSATAGYGTIAVRSRTAKVKAICAALIIAVGISRIGLGVHFPTDVLAGIAAGCLVIALDGALFRVVKSRTAVYLILILAFIPGLFFCRTEDFFKSYGVLAGGLAGMLYEEKNVGIKVKRTPVSALLRTAGGGLAFLAVNLSLKYLFTAFGVLPERSAFLIKTLRYAASAFVALGIYPYLFRFENDLEKIFVRKS